MKIAIISDIHGNLEALKATIKDIEKKQVDQIICLGDTIAKGIHPHECIKLIKEKCDIVIQGNTDEYFSKKHENISELPEQEQKRIKWNQSLITQEDREYLSNLPFSYEFYISGSLVRLFHATNKANNKAVLNIDDIEKKYEMFLPSERTISNKIADVVIFGHIHHPYMDKLYNKTLINVGSIGNSFDTIRNDSKDSNTLETTRAYYLIIEGEYESREYNSEISFQFVRVPYDIEKELKDEDKNSKEFDKKYISNGYALTIVDNDDIKSSMNDMLSSIDSIVAILIIAAASLAFVVLYNLSNINISERKREIATLKVLGFYPSEVDKYINRETVLLTILGIGIGLLFGSYLSHFIISTCEPDYIMFDRHVYTLSYFYSLFITVIFTIIVTIVTHFNLKKINMVTSLKNVE